MKALLLAAALLATGTAFADEPVGRRTPNGGFEYFTNSGANAGRGTVEHGCFLHWRHYGYHVLGYNPKLVYVGEIAEFVDCKLPKPVHKSKECEECKRYHVPTPVPAPVPAPMPAPVPAPMPEPLEPTDHVME